MMEIKNLVAAAIELRNATGHFTEQYKNCVCHQILKIFYDIGVSGRELNEKEGRTIGPFIKDIILELDESLFVLAWPFKPSRGPGNFVLRSGVQFLFDIFDNYFKRFPISEIELLEDSLNRLKESESLQHFDEELSNWKDILVESVESMPFPFKELIKPGNVPDSHIWWFENLEEAECISVTLSPV